MKCYQKVTLASLLLILLTSCATPPEDKIAEEVAKAKASEITTKVVEIVKQNPSPPLPELPNDCRRSERYQISEGDNAIVALGKSDIALSKANARIQRCAENYDRIKTAHELNSKKN